MTVEVPERASMEFGVLTSRDCLKNSTVAPQDDLLKPRNPFFADVVIAVVEPSSDAASLLEQKRPFIFSLQQMTIVTEGVKSVRIWAESVLGGFKAVVGRGSERIRSKGGGGRPRCSRCRGRHYSAGECKVGLSGSVSSIFTSQLLTFSLTPR